MQANVYQPQPAIDPGRVPYNTLESLLKLTHYTLPNLLTEEPLVPEFMQRDALPGPIATAVVDLLDLERRQAP